MNHVSLLQKLAPLGVAAIGAIAATGIATAPAQALILTHPSSLGWADTTDDWYDEVQPGENDSFDVLFNFDPNTIVITGRTGDFASDFSSGLVSMDNAPQLVGFLWQSGLGTEASPAIYKTQNQLLMSFDPAPNSTGNPNDATEYDWVVPSNSSSTRVTGFKDTNDTWQFSLCTTCGEAPYMLVDGTENRGQNTWQFSIGSQEETGGYSARFQTKPTPEPASVLGLLTFAGLGLGLKRKQQA
jgi:hypothetical protein